MLTRFPAGIPLDDLEKDCIYDLYLFNRVNPVKLKFNSLLLRRGESPTLLGTMAGKVRSHGAKKSFRISDVECIQIASWKE